MDENQNEVTITISGGVNVGKTTLATALSNFLKLRGFQVSVADDDPQFDRRATDFNDKCMEEIAERSLVRIVTARTRHR